MFFSFNEAPPSTFFMVTPPPSHRPVFRAKLERGGGDAPHTLLPRRDSSKLRREGEGGEREERREGIPEGDLALFQLALMHSRIQLLIVNIYNNIDIN
jgi:hypothetical protein